MPDGGVDPAALDDVLRGALRAPSAHNAQPWRLSHLAGDAYLVWYAYADKLLADPDDRDGLIAVGGFYETLRLCSEAVRLRATFEHAVVRYDRGISLGTVTFSALQDEPDRLAAAIGLRQCNRHPYAREALPEGLARGLRDLGNLLLAPDQVTGLVSRASVLSWRDRRFVSDLQEWTRFDDRSPDGMTLDCLRLGRFDRAALRLALRLRRLPRWLAWLYGQHEVRLTRSSAAMAVLTVESREPTALFECGRALVRSWTLINAAGYSWQPMSVVIDQSTVTDLASLLGGLDPVAIYRVGRTPHAAAWSKRRTLGSVLVPPP